MGDYTPGPWTIEEYGDDDAPALVIHKDTESRVCFMATPGSHGDPAKIEADARLIAAAPDQHVAALAIDRLFLVIECAVRCADPSQHSAVLAALQANHAAIAKATGHPTNDQ